MENKKVADILSKTPIAFAGSAAGLERFFRLEHWRVKVGDREDDRILWARGEFVLVVAITPEGKVVVIREYKQAAGMVLLGLPAGAKKKGEMPITTALRELSEETGYTGAENNCYVYGPFFNSPDKSTEKHYVVLVLDVEKSGPSNPDESETILEVELIDLELARGEIQIGLHRLALYEVQYLLANR